MGKLANKLSFLEKSYFLPLIGLIAFNISCTRKVSENSTITIVAPKMSPSAQNQPVSMMNLNLIGDITDSGSSDNDSPWNGEIYTASEVNCYGVFVGGFGDVDMTRNYCQEKDTGSELVRFGYFAGGVPAGGKIELEVPSKGDQIITLIAMHANSGYCRDFHNDGLEDGQVSHPRLIAQQKINLAPGSLKVEFSMPSDLTDLAQIDHCEVKDEFNNDGGGSGGGYLDLLTLFGDGKDGRVEAGGATGYLDFGIDDYTVLPWSPTAGSDITANKFPSNARKVTGILDAEGRQLQLNSPFTLNEFNVNDRVILHVSSGWADVSPDTDACGQNTGLYRGKWDIAGVVAVDEGTGTITLSKPITHDMSNMVSSSILSSTAASGVHHCNIQVARMPEIDSIQVGAGDNYTVTTPSFNFSSNGYGGILAMHIRRLEIASSASINFSAAGSGYVGGASGSDSLSGYSSVVSQANENSGGYDSANVAGGGGGQAGFGGNDLSSGQPTGGTRLFYCYDPSNSSNVPCMPFRDKKAFFGGAGGGTSSIAGGNGGGIVILFVDELVGDGTLNIDVSGNANQGTDSGGGAGGSIFLMVRDSRNAPGAVINLDAIGGDGLSNGGDGGGGSIELATCENLRSPTLSISASAEPGSATASPGQEATAGSIIEYDLEGQNYVASEVCQ